MNHDGSAMVYSEWGQQAGRQGASIQQQSATLERKWWKVRNCHEGEFLLSMVSWENGSVDG